MDENKVKGANRLERYEIVRMNRKQIKKAPYNPRKITATAEKNLRKSIREHGILDPIIVNKVTGNIVGGHQRLAQMDNILKKDDYDLTIALVSMDEKEEITANIRLNNTDIMGEFDVEALGEIHIDHPDIDFEKDLLFDKYGLDMMFSGTEFDMNTPEEVKEDQDTLERMREIDKIKQAKKEHRDKVKEENQTGTTHMVDANDYTVTFVFPNNSEKRDFMRRMKESEKEKFLKHTKLYDIAEGKYKIFGPEEDDS
jgi:hypothetical protein